MMIKIDIVVHAFLLMIFILQLELKMEVLLYIVLMKILKRILVTSLQL